MGDRQPRNRRVALACSLAALSGVACASGPRKGPARTAVDSVNAVDAGPDVEAQQIQSIAGALNEFGPAVHTCWARAAADDYQVSGQVILDLAIQEDGAAKVSLTTDEVQDETLSECLVALWSAYRWPASFVAGDRIQLPPFEFVAPDAQYVVASEHVAALGAPGASVQAQLVLHKANTGNEAASLIRLRYRAGAKVALHTHGSAQIFFVLAGEGLVTGIGADQKVAAGSAVYVPGGTIHGFAQQGDTEVELLQFYVPGGPEARFGEGTEASDTVLATGKVPKRGSRPLVRAVSEAGVYRILDGKAEVRILFDAASTGQEGAYLGAMTAQPGAVVPLHRHSASSEYLFVIEGEGEMSVAGKAIPVRAGDGIQIPPGVEHGVSISGASAFKALQLYSPAGPEQRFKAGSK